MKSRFIFPFRRQKTIKKNQAWKYKPIVAVDITNGRKFYFKSQLEAMAFFEITSQCTIWRKLQNGGVYKKRYCFDYGIEK